MIVPLRFILPDVLVYVVLVIAETEMGKLQRQFRIMDGDRQAYTIQSQELIRKQR
jgi:hypothetical protein